MNNFKKLYKKLSNNMKINIKNYKPINKYNIQLLMDLH